jgi:hypothetical protein
MSFINISNGWINVIISYVISMFTVLTAKNITKLEIQPVNLSFPKNLILLACTDCWQSSKIRSYLFKFSKWVSSLFEVETDSN